MIKKVDNLSNNFNEILKSFKDKWVAVPEDYSKVLASADTLNDLIGKVKKGSNLKMFKVIPLDMIYSPCNL